METLILKTDLHCESCIQKVEPILKSDNSIKYFEFDLNHPNKLIKIEANHLNLNSILSQIENAGYTAEKLVFNESLNFPKLDVSGSGFWSNNKKWGKASFNTLNCLIGCSIGDFGMIFYLQANYPHTSMIWQMILAIIAGLITSIILETIILRNRENFNWTLAFKTAFSMSFIASMFRSFAWALSLSAFFCFLFAIIYSPIALPKATAADSHHAGAEGPPAHAL